MRIVKNDTAALILDLQEKLLPAINNGAEVIRRCELLIQGLKILDIPIIIPRQYAKGLGDTVEPIRNAIGEHDPLDKLSFSACFEPEHRRRFQELNRKTILVCGIEAHVCVLQSVIDLLGLGYRVILVCDCIGSRFALDMEYGIRRAQQEGAILTTSEAVLFELIQCAGNDTFKAISKLLK